MQRPAISGMPRRWCVFTSAGDYHNVLAWIPDAPERPWDLIVAFYGDDADAFDTLQRHARAAWRVKGSKFQNLKRIYTDHPGLFAGYDLIWVVDDDLIVDPADIARLFQRTSEHDFWISQPAFSSQGRISHPVTAWAGADACIRIVNFVEVTCPLFRSDKLREFLAVYDGELAGWGIDWWYCNYFEANKNPRLAVIDEVVVTNPHDHQRRGRAREIVKLQSDEARYANWRQVAQRLCLSEYEGRTLAYIQRGPQLHAPASRAATDNLLKDIARDLPGRERRTIFDVGANAGQSTLRYVRQFPAAQVHAFEPVPEVFEKLVASVRAHANVHTHCLALSRKGGRRAIALQSDPAMNRFVVGDVRSESTLVRLTTLDAFCRRSAIEHIDLLKIDTAGHDLEVLRGARAMLPEIDFVQCVVSANAYNRLHPFFGDVSRHMFDNGFYLYRICEQVMEWTGGGYPVLRRFDAVFINARVVGALRNVLDQ